MTTKLLLFVAAAGHLLCGWSDCLMTYLPGGRFRFEDMRDNARLSRTFEGTRPERPILAMVAGCAAMFLFFFGYIALWRYVRPGAPVPAALMLAGCALLFTFGMAHHILCGVPEWLYVRLGRTDEARQLVLELFRRTAVTMIVCYAGYLLFGVALFVAVVSGATPLPRWACVFNILPLMLALLPTRVGGAGNWAGAVMCLGLALLV